MWASLSLPSLQCLEGRWFWACYYPNSHWFSRSNFHGVGDWKRRWGRDLRGLTWEYPAWQVAAGPSSWLSSSCLPHLGLSACGAAGTLLLPSNSLSWERMLKILFLRVIALSFPSAFSCSYRLLASRNFQRRKCLYQTHRCCTTSRDIDKVLPIIIIFLSIHYYGPAGLLLTKDAASGEMVVSPSSK